MRMRSRRSPKKSRKFSSQIDVLTLISRASCFGNHSFLHIVTSVTKIKGLSCTSQIGRAGPIELFIESVLPWGSPVGVFEIEMDFQSSCGELLFGSSDIRRWHVSYTSVQLRSKFHNIFSSPPTQITKHLNIQVLLVRLNASSCRYV